MSIECFSLTKKYGKKVALQDVSVEIPEGRITGLVGPNGAGKSTLLKLITGLIYPTEGFVHIDGFEVHGEHKQAMRQLGAIVEWPGFYADLSARRNLQILSGGYGRKYEEKLAEVTRFLGIENVLERKAGTFSTGMKQRLGIALAMLPDSKYVILDEPANGLDPAGIVEIRQLLKEYNRQTGATILLSSHLLGEIEMICDEIIMIADGRLKAAGRLDELLSDSAKIRLITPDLEGAKRFLQKAFEGKREWIASEPVIQWDSLVFDIPGSADPAAISSELFRAGFALAYFAKEQQDLEDFFLHSTTGDKK
jgi:ABC-2 type transport system ATP-binding protein